MRLLWALSVAAAAAAAAGLTYAATAMEPVSTSSGAPQISTLQPVSGVQFVLDGDQVGVFLDSGE